MGQEAACPSWGSGAAKENLFFCAFCTTIGVLLAAPNMECLTNRRESITAYVDPNSGGMLFQALAASFAAISGPPLSFSLQIRAGFACAKRASSDRLSGEVEEALAPDLADDQPWRVWPRPMKLLILGFDAFASYGPDLFISDFPGHRASADTGLGKWGPETPAPNRHRSPRATSEEPR